MPYNEVLELSRQYNNAVAQIQAALTEINQCCVYTGMSTSEVPGNYLSVGFAGVVPTRCDWLMVVLTDDNIFMSFDDGVTWLNVFDPSAIGVILVSSGMIIEYGGDENNVPTGYLLCDGSEVSRTTYADLFTAISTTFGVGDGSTTFNLPDLRGVSPKGVNFGSYSNGSNGALATTALGDSGGVETHQLTTAQMASHNHTARPASSQGCQSGGSQRRLFSAGNTPNTGGDVAHNEIHPGIVVNYIIKT